MISYISSVAAGHDSFFNQSYPVVGKFEIYISIVFEFFGFYNYLLFTVSVDCDQMSDDQYFPLFYYF